MPNNRGIVHLLPLIFLALVAIVFYLLVFNRDTLLSLLPGKGTKVQLQTLFKNPFDKTAQYVNPFAEYKNPFDRLR